MKRRIKIFTVIAVLLVMAFPSAAAAADVTVSLSGNSTVKKGEIVTVTVTYKGSALGFVNGAMTYDTENLEYLSGGSSSGDSGTVQLKSWSDDASGKIAFAVKFRGAGAGKANLNVETFETQNLDGIELSTPSAGKTVSVKESAAPSKAETTAATEAKPETEPSSSQQAKASVPQTFSEQEDIAATADSLAADAEKKDDSNGTTLILVGAAAVIVILIAVTAIAIRKKKKKRR